MRNALAAIVLVVTVPASAAVDPAIFTDPPHDPQHPARMEVIHIPSGGVEINGLVYVAAGAGPHPVLVLCHGLPGNEKNLDLAQAVRRAGWTVVTFNYRGSWGSPGVYRFGQDLEDAQAVLAYVRNPAHSAALGLDPKHVAIAGHSLGGWVTALTAARDKDLVGVALISAGNIGARGRLPRDVSARHFAENGVEALAGTSPDIMADETIAHADAFDFLNAADGLSGKNLLVVTSDDGLTSETDALVKKLPPAKVRSVHIATDHGYSDARIRLADTVISWLKGLPR